MTDNENKPAAVPSWCGVCGKPIEQVSGWCDKPGICPHGQIAQLRKAREAAEKPKASTVQEVPEPNLPYGPLERSAWKSGWQIGYRSASQIEETPAGISIQDLVAEHRKDPRKAVALDRVKDAHVAAAAPEHAQPSIADDPEFRAMYLTCAGTLLWTEESYRQKAAYIDAKLNEARHEAWCEGVNIDALHEHNAELTARAEKAEAQLTFIMNNIGHYEQAEFYDKHGNNVYVNDLAALLEKPE